MKKFFVITFVVVFGLLVVCSLEKAKGDGMGQCSTKQTIYHDQKVVKMKGIIFKPVYMESGELLFLNKTRDKCVSSLDKFRKMNPNLKLIDMKMFIIGVHNGFNCEEKIFCLQVFFK
ncbi:MAG: hypothetical protein ABIF22_02625 [bacterium]